MLTSLIHPAHETHELFDDIILLCGGEVVYQGPREYVFDFFESMVFKFLERNGVSNFLHEVIIIFYTIMFGGFYVVVVNYSLDLKEERFTTFSQYFYEARKYDREDQGFGRPLRFSHALSFKEQGF